MLFPLARMNQLSNRPQIFVLLLCCNREKTEAADAVAQNDGRPMVIIGGVK